jgi:hypothetical protein
MGADIHIVIERRYGDKWVGVRTDEGIPKLGYADTGWDYNAPAVGQRDYAFFARLAGVRGDGPSPVGLPDDASDLSVALFEDWGVDAHSHSWLPLEEFAMRWCADNPEFIATMTRERLEGGDASYFRLLNKASIYAYDGDGDDYDITDFRVVFWFDN